VLTAALRSRFEHQLDALALVLRDTAPIHLEWRPADGRWSARENLAHAARHQEVLRQRLERILAEDGPRLERYRAEEDPAWPEWAALDTAEVLVRLRQGRRQLLALLDGLTAAQLERAGEHRVFGRLTIPEWLEFFLLHEAHHLYTALGRVGEARRQAPASGA
jgi:DinB superfamily